MTKMASNDSLANNLSDDDAPSNRSSAQMQDDVPPVEEEAAQPPAPVEIPTQLDVELLTCSTTTAATLLAQVQALPVTNPSRHSSAMGNLMLIAQAAYIALTENDHAEEDGNATEHRQEHEVSGKPILLLCLRGNEVDWFACLWHIVCHCTAVPCHSLAPLHPALALDILFLVLLAD